MDFNKLKKRPAFSDDDYQEEPVPQPKGITLTDHQNEALNDLIEWTESDDPFHALIGSAGVGKTTVLKEFITKNKFRWSTCVSAPTHKAKKVCQRATGLDAVTIQGLLGLRPNTDIENFDINNPQFDPLADKQIAGMKLVIIDEASMLNKDLHEMICQEARKNNCKILFVGDSLQLPPVNEKISQAILSHPTTELTEVIRQSNTNPLSRLLAALRYDIINGTETFFSEINNVPEEFNDKGEGYAIMPLPKFQESIISHYNSPEYDANADYCKTVAWTNDCVSEWNRFIRKSKFTTTDILTPGDVLMAYASVSDKFKNNIITNSEDYVVESVQELNGNESYPNITNYLVKCVRVDSPLKTVFNVLHPDARMDFLAEERGLHQIAIQRKGRAWVQYYDFRRQFLLMEDIKHAGKLVVKKELDYGYSITTHKTQGSTYETVFVNLPNIMRNGSITDRKKLTYVALSRASKKCLIYYNM